MLRRSFHTSVTKKSGAKVWSDFSARPIALSIPSEKVKSCVLNGTSAQGPPSLKKRSSRIKYQSPEKIDEVFKTCYDFLESRGASKYAKLKDEQNIKKRTQLAAEAEINNPEVLYNFQYNEKIENDPRIIDYNVPVYRYLGRKHWESYGQMLLMQRLETLAVIPDTMPTLVPRADINIKFPFSTGLNKWVEPGEVLSSNATSLAPAIKIQEYEDVDPTEQLYTALIVNPDEPDLTTDSFKTTLQYGLVNLKISYNDNILDARKFTDDNVVAEYLPPVPEKNAGTQRFAVWVFRQSGPLKISQKRLNRDSFDLRRFVHDQALTPIGAHVWRSQWDSNVNNVRAKYGMPEGRVFHRVRKS
ncbi:LANO_0B05798g1_1 [Lachancea nothofagi CBS 11611]|uniref:Large ribosomal subunit protein mL38 n=1 Tax=Lachancea nothofagi CBS 11611 TaxID=1266666 RepID=A0A1G4IYM5_9SACH|nr:LANO_0B05798g1_1 [Lachancea nothofagi CBS 11611]